MEVQVEKKERRAKVPIVIPGAENMTPEELKKAKHNEKMRRYLARKDGREPGDIKKTGQEVRILSNKDLIDLTADSRNTAIEAINLKLKQLVSNPEALEKINLVTLTTAFGTLFDKGQLMNGLATSNVSVHAKIDINMSSNEALEQLNKIREQYAESNG